MSTKDNVRCCNSVFGLASAFIGIEAVVEASELEFMDYDLRLSFNIPFSTSVVLREWDSAGCTQHRKQSTSSWRPSTAGDNGILPCANTAIP